MDNNWFSRLIRQIPNEPPPLPAPVPSEPSLDDFLTDYQRELDNLSVLDDQSLLKVLLIRDKVETILQKTKSPTLIQVQKLTTMDTHLRNMGLGKSASSLTNWRVSIHPPESNWWWYLDNDLKKREQEKDLLWEILAVTLFILTVPIIVDMIQRLWANAPDNTAIVGTLLILLITASPFTKRGRELTQWLLKRVSWLPSNRRAEAMAMTAMLAFLLVAACRFILMPQYARITNDQGVAALEQGDLTTARQHFQRAATINKDFSVSYYNLASLYEDVAQPGEAIALYQEALAHDLNLIPAYNNLGRLYLEQGEPQKAITLLRAGLTHLGEVEEPTETVTRYQLLTHLGQAYYELEDIETAVSTLQQAIILENDPQLDLAFHNARPHYFLALAYETLGYPSADIISEWEAALSYLDDEDPIGWETAIREHLETWR